MENLFKVFCPEIDKSMPDWIVSWRMILNHFLHVKVAFFLHFLSRNLNIFCQISIGRSIEFSFFIIFFLIRFIYDNNVALRQVHSTIWFCTKCYHTFLIAKILLKHILYLKYWTEAKSSYLIHTSPLHIWTVNSKKEKKEKIVYTHCIL